VEKALETLGDKAPSHERARCEQLISDIRRAIQEEAPLERIRELKEELQQASHNISSTAYDQSGGAGDSGQGGYGPYGGNVQGNQTGTATKTRPKEDDVIDAEFSEG